MKELENKITELNDIKEQLEYLIELIEDNNDYKKDTKYLKGLLDEINYDIEQKEEELDEQKEFENIRQAKQYADYLDDCVISDNTQRI